MVHQLTIEAYNKIGKDYKKSPNWKEYDYKVELYRQKTSNDKDFKSWIHEATRLRTQFGDEVLLYSVKFVKRTNETNMLLDWTELPIEFCYWLEPQPEITADFDKVNEKMVKHIQDPTNDLIHYLIPFNAENVEKYIKPLFKFQSKLYVKQEGQDSPRQVTNIDDWINRKFDDLLIGLNKVVPQVATTGKKS